MECQATIKNSDLPVNLKILKYFKVKTSENILERIIDTERDFCLIMSMN